MKPTSLLAIEIGGTKLQLIAAGLDGGIIRRERRNVVREDGAESIRRQISEVIEAWRDEFQWAAVGVGFGGPVERGSGKISASFHISGWDGFPLGNWISDLAGAPVTVENDTNAAAFGEAAWGAGKGANPVFYTNSGSGVGGGLVVDWWWIGGGLVVDGSIYHGAAPGEAEFGHLRLDKSGTIVEDRCSGWALDQAVRRICENGNSLLSALIGSTRGGEARHLPAAIAQGDLAAREIMEAAAGDLAYALSHVVHLFHPERIILGGGVSLIGEPWKRAVAEALPQYLMAPFQPGPEVRLTILGEDTVLVGVIASAKEIC